MIGNALSSLSRLRPRQLPQDDSPLSALASRPTVPMEPEMPQGPSLAALEGERDRLNQEAYGGPTTQMRQPFDKKNLLLVAGASALMKLFGVQDSDIAEGVKGYTEGATARAKMDFDNEHAQEQQRRKLAMVQAGTVGDRIQAERSTIAWKEKRKEDAKNQSINDMRDTANKIMSGVKSFSSSDIRTKLETANKLYAEAGLPGMQMSEEQIIQAVADAKSREAQGVLDKDWPKEIANFNRLLSQTRSNISSGNWANAEAAALQLKLIMDKYPDKFAAPENMALVMEVQDALEKAGAQTSKEKLDLQKIKESEAMVTARVAKLKADTKVSEERAKKLAKETSHLDDESAARVARGWAYVDSVRSGNAKRSFDMDRVARQDAVGGYESQLKALRAERAQLFKLKNPTPEQLQRIQDIGDAGKQVIQSMNEIESSLSEFGPIGGESQGVVDLVGPIGKGGSTPVAVRTPSKATRARASGGGRVRTSNAKPKTNDGRGRFEG